MSSKRIVFLRSRCGMGLVCTSMIHCMESTAGVYENSVVSMSVLLEAIAASFVTFRSDHTPKTPKHFISRNNSAVLVLLKPQNNNK
eukprot:6471695-Amphidinium_carterae.1